MAKDGAPQSAGGKARAQVLSQQERSEIARRAAQARWSDDIQTATHEGVLRIGEADLPCYVLEDGTRILSTRGVMSSLGRTWRGRKYSGSTLPVFLEARNLAPFISDELMGVLEPRHFRPPTGGARSEGFPAQILPLVCDVYLSARDAGALTASQQSVAKNCEILVRSLSKVGVIALVDEATGYQETRDKQALQALLDQYLKKELAAWAKRFPDDFYKEMFRLCGWRWTGMSARPGVVGHFTKDIVYERLAPGIVEELERINPKNEKGNRRAKHHQWLTDDVGHPALSQHLYAVIGVMRGCRNWPEFKLLLDRFFPKKGDTLPMPLD